MYTVDLLTFVSLTVCILIMIYEGACITTAYITILHTMYNLWKNFIYNNIKLLSCNIILLGNFRGTKYSKMDLRGWPSSYYKTEQSIFASFKFISKFIKTAKLFHLENFPMCSI